MKWLPQEQQKDGQEDSYPFPVFFLCCRGYRNRKNDRNAALKKFCLFETLWVPELSNHQEAHKNDIYESGAPGDGFGCPDE